VDDLQKVLRACVVARAEPCAVSTDRYLRAQLAAVTRGRTAEVEYQVIACTSSQMSREQGHRLRRTRWRFATFNLQIAQMHKRPPQGTLRSIIYRAKQDHQVGLCPLVTSQHSSTTLYQISDHVQSLFS
jgi:hypothetical protein